MTGALSYRTLARSSLAGRSNSTLPSPNAWPRRAWCDEGQRSGAGDARTRAAPPGRPADAPGARGAGRRRPPTRAWRGQRLGGDRHVVGRGVHAARGTPGQGGPANGPTEQRQDARRLRLLLPALARPQPDPHPGTVGLHRPPRGRAPPRPARVWFIMPISPSPYKARIFWRGSSDGGRRWRRASAAPLTASSSRSLALITQGAPLQS